MERKRIGIGDSDGTTESETSRRLQIGTAGLVAVALIVSLVSVALSGNESGDGAEGNEVAEAAAKGAAISEPLAELGAQPSRDPAADEEGPPDATITDPAPVPVVNDLDADEALAPQIPVDN